MAAALVKLASVERAAVVSDDDKLVAYVVMAPASDQLPVDIRRELRDVLPAYAIPSSVVSLPELPLLPNGKPDLVRIRAISMTEHRAVRTAEPLQGPAEELVGELWSSLLGITG